MGTDYDPNIPKLIITKEVRWSEIMNMLQLREAQRKREEGNGRRAGMTGVKGLGMVKKLGQVKVQEKKWCLLV